jgi:hypothetical protein
MLAFVASAVTVVPEQRWMLDMFVLLLAGLGAISLGISFYLHRRARHFEIRHPT